MIVISGLVLVAAILWAVSYVADFMSEDMLVEATGQNNINFTVHYLENEIFGENPVSADYFLRLFTDFIEVESSFSVNFNEDLDIDYTYVAQKRFVITYAGSGGSNPVIFEETKELSRASGSAHGRRLSFDSYNVDGEPGGTYIIFPRDYMEIYLNFLDYHEQHVENEGGTASSFRGFSAELFIEFTYSILAIPIGMSETTTRGYRIPISQDVFIPEVRGGIAGFTASASASTETPNIDLFTILVFALVLIFSAIIMFVGIKCLSADGNKRRKKAKTILKKFSSEIVVSRSPMNLSRYNIMVVDDFDEILKLSVNLNKHIMCYHNAEKMELCTIVEEHAYYYCINYWKDKNDALFGPAGLAQAENVRPTPSEIKLVSDLLYSNMNAKDFDLHPREGTKETEGQHLA